VVALVVVASETVKQILHDLGERVACHLEKEVNMVRHQNIGVEREGVPFLSLLQKELELKVVTSIPKDGLALVASADDMVEGSRKMDACPPSHEAALTFNRRQSK